MIFKLFKKKEFLFAIFIFGLLLARFAWLSDSARFTRDESSDLARMHEYWAGKKITLVGPISNDNVKVFSSLTYYMLMPFAALGKFDPVSPVWGTAFYGVATALLLLSYLKKNNKSLLFLLGIFLIVWNPLLQSSRWAWNPHLVPFWMALALWSQSKKSWKWLFISGLSLGLSIHNHYIALIPALTFLGIIIAKNYSTENKFSKILSLVCGFGLALAPFIMFDLRHPPGLFIKSYLLSSQPNLETSVSGAQLAMKIWQNLSTSIETFVPIKILSQLALLVLCLLIINDISKKRIKSLLMLLPIATLLLAGSFLDGFHPRYVMSILPFFITYLFQDRIGIGKGLQVVLIGCLLAASIWRLPATLLHSSVQPSIRTLRSASNYIDKTMKENITIKNANITTDMSEDGDMLSLKYRDYLSIKGIQFRAASEYDASENLFVISQETENRLRESESFPLKIFSKQPVRDSYHVPNSNWKVYWFSY